jgi:hypothetical protein
MGCVRLKGISAYYAVPSELGSMGRLGLPRMCLIVYFSER